MTWQPENTESMINKPVTTDPGLRRILRAGRRAAGNISQQVAASRARISTVYWQKIESGAVPQIPAGTAASMLQAVEATPQDLRDQGYIDVAAAMDELAAAGRPELSPEEHLAATPGATPEDISALQAVWRALKSPRTTDPLADLPGPPERRKRPRQP